MELIFGKNGCVREGLPDVLNLARYRLVDLRKLDLDAVRFLAVVERGGLALRNLPPYIRAWVLLERERPATPSDGLPADGH